MSAEAACLTTRVNVPSAAGRRVVPEALGIHCVLVPAQGPYPALLVLRDEQQLNTGASVTNALELVLDYLCRLWGAHLAPEDTNVVECDSSGAFDLVCVRWNGSSVDGVNWRALRWPGTTPRTQDAFTHMFGPQAQRALQALGLRQP